VARRRYGDETWRLAVAGDAAGLHRVADLLLGESEEESYDGHRARAFAHAVEGRTAAALEQLNEGWTEDWPFPSAYAADIARVRFLGGDYTEALEALHLSVRGADRVDPAVSALAAAAVRGDRRLVRPALRVAFAGGTPRQRLATAGRVLAARVRATRGSGG